MTGARTIQRSMTRVISKPKYAGVLLTVDA